MAFFNFCVLRSKHFLSVAESPSFQVTRTGRIKGERFEHTTFFHFLPLLSSTLSNTNSLDQGTPSSEEGFSNSYQLYSVFASYATLMLNSHPHFFDVLVVDIVPLSLRINFVRAANAVYV